MLILKNKNLTVQTVKRLNLAVFTWRGSTLSDVFKEGTDQSLEILRDHPSINRILLNTKDHVMVMQADIEASVNSTVDYIGIARGNYRMGVVPPTDARSHVAIDFYIDSLNKILKKRFVVKKLETTKQALAWLIRGKIRYSLGI